MSSEVPAPTETRSVTPLDKMDKQVKSAFLLFARPAVFMAIGSMLSSTVLTFVVIGWLPSVAMTLLAAYWSTIGTIVAVFYSKRSPNLGGGGFGLPYGYGGVGYAPAGMPGSFGSTFVVGTSAVGMLPPTAVPATDSPTEVDV